MSVDKKPTRTPSLPPFLPYITFLGYIGPGDKKGNSYRQALCPIDGKTAIDKVNGVSRPSWQSCFPASVDLFCAGDHSSSYQIICVITLFCILKFQSLSGKWSELMRQDILGALINPKEYPIRSQLDCP